MRKITKTFSIIFSCILLKFNSIILADSTESYSYNYGKVFYYTPIHKEKCTIKEPISNDWYKVAVSPDLFFKGATCGACIKGEISFHKKKEVFKGVITNVYNGLYYGDMVINSKNTHSDAMWPIQWKFIKCPTNIPTLSPTQKPTSIKCKNSLMHPNGKVCCPKSCKICGNPDCELRPGGEKECCYKGIIKFNNVSCDKNPAPCVI